MSKMKAFDPKILIGKDKAPCDIFAELSGGTIVKICQAGNLINQELIDKCSHEATVKVYMLEEDYALHVMKKTPAPSMIEGSEDFGIQASSVKIVRGYMHSFGVPDKVIKLVDKTVSSTLHTLEKEPSIGTIINDIMKKGDFFEEKALLMCYLSIFALSYIDKNNEHGEALGMAALLHDFKLQSKDSLKIELNSKKIKELQETSQEVLLNLETHAQTEALILKESSCIPAEVVRLVLMHHEPIYSRYDAFGRRARPLSKLGQIFNISHEIAVYLLFYGASKHNFSDFYFRLTERVLPEYKKTAELFGGII